MQNVQETQAWYINGFLGLVYIVLVICAGAALILAANAGSPILFIPGALLLGFTGLLASGFFVVQPNEAKALVFLGGRYVGTVRKDGFFFANPLTVKRNVSMRIRNFQSEKLKVNDAQGNPIEIAAVVAWRVIDSAQALFDVENYASFVAVQSETAIQALVGRYPYDNIEEGQASLRGNADEVAQALRDELQARLRVAGVEVLEARFTRIAYAPEIAQAMLRRQQAQAVIAARTRIVEGAVGMVEMALKRLREENVIELDEERKAQMVNNLLVTLVSERDSQPVINAGSLY